MKKYFWAILCFILILSGCGGGAKKQQAQLIELEARSAATTVAGAESAYNEIAKFVDDLDDSVNPVILECASKLREKRALEFKKAVIKHRAIGSTTKVLKALKDSGALMVGNFGLGDDLSLGQLWRFIGPPEEIKEKK